MEDKITKKSFNFKEFLRGQLATLPLKVVILTFSGGAICIFPFLVLQMKDLGLTINEIAAMFLIVPIASLLGPVASGLIADKIGKYSLVFVSNIVLATITFNLLLIIPAIPQETATLKCDRVTTLKFDNCNECLQKLHEQGYSEEQVVLKECHAIDEYPTEVTSNDSFPTSCLYIQNYENVTVNISSNENLAEKETCNAVVTGITYLNKSLDIPVGLYDDYTERELRCSIASNVEDCRELPLVSETFMYVGSIMFVSNFFIAAAFTMLDATLLQFVKEHNVNLGKQKIMTMIGFGLAPLLAGFLIDIHAKKIGRVSYLPAFLLSNALMTLAVIATYFVKMKADKNESNIIKDLGKLVISLEVDLFLLLVLVLGCNFGFIESYLFIYLQSLNAPNFLLGLTMTVGCLSSIPMLFCADWLEGKIGRHYIFMVCFTAYAARMFGYSFIHNPWMCLIFESLEAVTYQLMWVTCLRLCPLLSPKGMLATMTGLTGSIHYSFGKGIGGFLGGHLINIYGLRKTFRIFGGIALAGGVFYVVVHYAFFKRKFEEKEREMAEEQRKLKEEEAGKGFLDEKGNKCPSYDQLNTMSLEFHNSFLTLPSPQNKLSEEWLSSNGSHYIFNGGKQRKSSSRRSSDEIGRRSLFTGSVPQLYVAEAYDLMARSNQQNDKNMSKSAHNIN